MKVSFLVTYYNQEQYVRQSLDSILAIEKPCDWEILVGDDGSTDGTLNIVRQYMEAFPGRIFLHQMPREPGKKYNSVERASANRLNLVEHAAGDFFCTLDGDDWYCDTGFLSDALAVFSENQGVGAVGFGYQRVTDGIAGEPHTLPEGMDHSLVDKEEYLNRYYLHAGACVHRRSWGQERMAWLKGIGFFDDNDILINSLNFGELYAINRVIYSYRQTGESVYNSMSMVEQAVLNVQGLDADLKLMDRQHRDALLRRNEVQILILYIWKGRLKAILGQEKFQQYSEGCARIPGSMAYTMLNYRAAPRKERAAVRKVVFPIMGRHPRIALSMYRKYVFNKIGK